MGQRFTLGLVSMGYCRVCWGAQGLTSEPLIKEKTEGIASSRGPPIRNWESHMALTRGFDCPLGGLRFQAEDADG